MAELQLLTLEIHEFRFFELFHLTLPPSLPPLLTTAVHYVIFVPLFFPPFLAIELCTIVCYKTTQVLFWIQPSIPHFLLF